MAKRNRTNGLEDKFALSEDYLHQPVVAELRPGLVEATTKDGGEDRLLKIWWKTGRESDDEFRELWNHERLQVERAMEFPDADEVLVGIVEMIETSDAFCVVYEAGSTPLAARQRAFPARHWSKGLEAASNRIVLWRNLARLGKALGIIHAQGLIHGRLDRHAVFTEGGPSPDFKLGGFEWSLGVGEVQTLDVRAANVRARIDRLIYSYADDWRALGILVAELLGLDPARLRADDPFRQNAAAFDIGDAELEMLRKLVEPSREDALDARSVGRDVEAICRELGRHGGGRSARFILLLRMNDRMREAIDAATDGEAPLDDPEAQTSYVAADIASGARLVVSERDDLSALEVLTVVTEGLSYRVRPFTDNGPPTWQVATVVSIQPRTKARLPADRDVYALPHEIVVTRNKEEALASLASLRGQAIDWTVPVAKPQAAAEDPDALLVRQSMLMVQVVEALVKVLDILPVRVVDRRSHAGKTIVRLAPREGSARDAIASEMDERAASDVMERLFEKEDAGVDIDWLLSTSGALSSRQAADVRARFGTCVRGSDGGTLYEFEIFGLLGDGTELFLRRSGEIGTESLIRRKLRTTRALADQRDLVTMFVDPRRKIRSTNEPLVEDAAFDQMDQPKQSAMKAIWSTTPTHLVVGPPGVGKTRLTTEIVRRMLNNEPADRILLSAQSHQALDHLLAAVRRELPDGIDTIVVRSRGADDAASTDEDVRRTALSYLDRILGSRLINQAPSPLRDNLTGLKDAIRRSAEESRTPHESRLTDRREAAGLRALEALVLESANVVCSTSNSLDIERMVEDGAQFDRVIVEEAAKAAGPELVAPLSLSGRRLLIGDHHQLPPFDAERLARILGNRTAVRNAIAQADAVVGSTFFESGLDELRRSIADEDALDRISAFSLRVLEPFKSLVVEDEGRRAVTGGRRRTVASELSCQHRMDPAIARLISECFYGGRLDTAGDRIRTAERPLPFTFGEGFSEAPVVFVDMPFASRTGRAEPVESDRPRWHNPTERRLVAELLERLQGKVADDGMALRTTTVAVLSPYRAQIDRMLPKIETFRLRCGTTFGGFTHDGRIHGTVDSSQGSEADLVIVSLVRNNHRSGMAALGFLRDPRRMNVLLSRAKLQLVLVGSIEFLRESVRHASAADGHQLSFVKKFLETLESLCRERAMRGGPAAEIIPVEHILGGRRL